jgi:hypothetical protein
MDGTHSRAGAAAQIGSHEVHAVHRLSEGIVRCVPRVHPPARREIDHAAFRRTEMSARHNASTDDKATLARKDATTQRAWV